MSIDVKNLKISLTSGKRIVDNISFHIKKGEMLSIVGGSGAGKSTICRAIIGLLGTNYKKEGEIIYQKENLLDFHQKKLRHIHGKDICFIMQNPMTAFNPSLKIGKQLEKTYLQHNKRISRAEMLSQFETTLNRLGLEDTKRILKSYPFTLSGGMLQRIMIGAALINHPQLLIADEPTTAIDPCNRMELMRKLKKLCHEGMSILFVTHDLRAAANSNKILIVNQGKTVEYGNTKNILNNPKEKYTKYLLNACCLERMVC